VDSYARRCDDEEEEFVSAMHTFVTTKNDPFSRQTAAEHITASAWILDTNRTHALLCHHRKLDMWVQLGGHLEPSLDDSVHAGALREAYEESGLGAIKALSPDIFDIDIHAIPAHGDEGVRDTGGQLTLAIFECKKPVIAAINGAAVGIGATMSCAMDIRLVSEAARVGFVFNKIGITPEAASSWFLPRIVNMGTALEWIYSGDLIGAEELTQKGFANHQLAAEELLPKAYEIARRITQHSQVAIALSRQMMYRNASLPHPQSAHEVDSLAIFYASQSSGKEGVSAFLEKRPPEFVDKASTDMPPFYPWW